ncbi:MAG: serine protease [Burkholderiaceae bacterium]|nr:serine protease [Burkholderiaceae bacterium]
MKETIVIALSLAVAAATAPYAAAQGLPEAPTPVPGSLLDRGGRSLPAPIPTPRSAQADSRADRPTKRMHVSSGSGFYVSNDGYLVTNNHVVEGCTRLARGDGTPLELVAADEKNDLALLKGPPVVDSASLRVAPDAMQGEPVLTYGYPLQGVLSSSGQLGAGMVSALAGLRDHPGHLQIDVPVQPGNSGGPLLDRRGLVVGVVVAKLNALRVAQMTGDIPQNINFAVKLAPLKALLDANNVRYAGGSAHTATLENEQIALRARSFTTPVFCGR